MFHRYQALQSRRRGRLLVSDFVSAGVDAKQADHNRPDRITAVARAEVQYESFVCSKAFAGCRSGELFDQPRLADASFAAHRNCLPAATGTARLNYAGKLRQLAAPANKRNGRSGRRRQKQTPDTPYFDRHIDTFDGNLAERLTVGPVADGAAQGLGDERLSRLRLVLEASRQIHRLAGDGILAVRLAAGAAGHDLAIGNADVSLQLAATER